MVAEIGKTTGKKKKERNLAWHFVKFHGSLRKVTGYSLVHCQLKENKHDICNILLFANDKCHATRVGFDEQIEL